MEPERAEVKEPPAWRSKIMLVMLTILSVWVWSRPAMMDINVVFSTVALLGLGLDILYHLARGAAVRLAKALRDPLACVAFLAAMITAFFYSFVISGEWGPVGFVPFICYASFHMHHWLKSLVLISRMLAIIRCLERKEYLAQSRINLMLGSFLLGWGVLCLAVPGWFWGNFSFVKMTVILGSGFLFLGTVLRTQEVASRYFRVLIVILLGMFLGVFANGVMGIIRDSVPEGKIPGSLIFFSDEENCQIPPDK